MKKNIQPLGENVLIKILKSDSKSKSGLVLPDTASEDRPQEGKVVAIGENKGIKVKKGQTVIFANILGWK